MPCRQTFGLAIAAVSALGALTACQGSPEAGRPNTASTSITASPTSTPTAASTPRWSTEEQAAITAAKSQYTAARAAIDATMHNPSTATRAKLLQAGNGGNWLIQLLGEVKFDNDRGWYQAGNVVVESMSTASVRLNAEQPEVRLNVCLDTSTISLRFQGNHKPVPVGPSNGDRHQTQAVLVHAAATGQTEKRWFLIDEEAVGTC